MKAEHLLLLGMLATSMPLAGAACPEAGDLDEPPVAYQEEMVQASCCSRFGASCMSCLRRPAIRCALRVCCISTIFVVGFFIHVDLLNLMNNDIGGFNNLMTFLWPNGVDQGIAPAPEATAAVHAASHHPVKMPHLPTIAEDSVTVDDELIIALLRRHFADVCDDLHIEEGQPIPERAKQMLKFLLIHPKHDTAGRGAYEDDAALRARLANSVLPKSIGLWRAFSATFG